MRERDQLDNALSDLLRVSQFLETGGLDRIVSFIAGPSGGGVHGGRVSDPTAAAALNPDEFRVDAERFRWHLRAVSTSTSALTKLVAKYDATPVPLACGSCTRVPWATEIEVETRKDGTPYYANPPRCRWCARHRDPVTGEDPPIEAVERHQRGERVSSVDIAQMRRAS